MKAWAKHVVPAILAGISTVAFCQSGYFDDEPEPPPPAEEHSAKDAERGRQIDDFIAAAGAKPDWAGMPAADPCDNDVLAHARCWSARDRAAHDSIEFPDSFNGEVAPPRHTLREFSYATHPAGIDTAGTRASVSPVPEPGTWLMTVCGLAAVGVGARRQRTKDTKKP